MLTHDYLTRDQRRVAEFLSITHIGREAANQVPGLGPVAGATYEALSYFIEAELQHRRVERHELLQRPHDSSAQIGTNAARLNDRGLAAVARAQSSISAAREHLAKLEWDGARVEALAGDFHDDLRAFLSHTELKAGDIRRIDEIVGEIVAATRKGGVLAALEQVELGTRQLDELRRREDRGAVENFPIWKLGGLIVILGVGIIALIHCGIFGCSISTRNAYIAALITAALVTLGC